VYPLPHSSLEKTDYRNAAVPAKTQCSRIPFYTRVRLFVADKCLGLVERLGGVLSGSAMAAVRGAFLSQRVDGSTDE
jgi:hypothetical protein